MTVAFDDSMTLGEAKEILRGLVQEGANCPCCTQFARVYKRKVHATMATALIAAWRHGGREFAYLPDTLTHRQNADFAKLAYWGLIEAEVGTRDDGSKRTGRWRVTQEGEDWLLLRRAIPKYAHIYDGRCLRLSGDGVSIIEALGARFKYSELLGT